MMRPPGGGGAVVVTPDHYQVSFVKIGLLYKRDFLADGILEEEWDGTGHPCGIRIW